MSEFEQSVLIAFLSGGFTLLGIALTMFCNYKMTKLNAKNERDKRKEEQRIELLIEKKKEYSELLRVMYPVCKNDRGALSAFFKYYEERGQILFLASVEVLTYMARFNEAAHTLEDCEALPCGEILEYLVSIYNETKEEIKKELQPLKML